MSVEHLVVVGLSHRTAPVAVRERAVVLESEYAVTLDHLRRHAREVVVLSTCNRTEVYLAGVEGDAMAAFEGAWGHAMRAYAYEYRGEAAVRHLFRVASGLDALVLGETQVLSQVKRAWEAARANGATGAELNRAFQGALAAAKRAHAETSISRNAVSVSAAAVDLARGVLGSLEGSTALVVGAGETAELTLRHLSSAGVNDVLVVNRTLARAMDLAERWGGRACNLEGLRETLPLADVVIASSAAPHPVVRAEYVREALAARGGRPIFLIDISVPRNIHPDVGTVDGAYLYDLDDLNAAVRRNLRGREAAVPAVNAILDAGVEGFLEWDRAHEAAPLIRAVRARFEETAGREVEKALRRGLRGLDDAQAAALRALVGGLMNRVAAPVIEAAKSEEARAALAAAFAPLEADGAPAPAGKLADSPGD